MIISVILLGVAAVWLVGWKPRVNSRELGDYGTARFLDGHIQDAWHPSAKLHQDEPPVLGLDLQPSTAESHRRAQDDQQPAIITIDNGFSYMRDQYMLHTVIDSYSVEYGQERDKLELMTITEVQDYAASIKHGDPFGQVQTAAVLDYTKEHKLTPSFQSP